MGAALRFKNALASPFGRGGPAQPGRRGLGIFYENPRKADIYFANIKKALSVMLTHDSSPKGGESVGEAFRLPQHHRSCAASPKAERRDTRPRVSEAFRLPQHHRFCAAPPKAERRDTRPRVSEAFRLPQHHRFCTASPKAERRDTRPRVSEGCSFADARGRASLRRGPEVHPSSTAGRQRQQTPLRRSISLRNGVFLWLILSAFPLPLNGRSSAFF